MSYGFQLFYSYADEYNNESSTASTIHHHTNICYLSCYYFVICINKQAPIWSPISYPIHFRKYNLSKLTDMQKASVMPWILVYSSAKTKSTAIIVGNKKIFLSLDLFEIIWMNEISLKTFFLNLPNKHHLNKSTREIQIYLNKTDTDRIKYDSMTLSFFFLYTCFLYFLYFDFQLFLVFQPYLCEF